MQISEVKKLLFSSSASIYGEPKYLPIDENHPLNALNPYGESKLIVEKILSDLSYSDRKWSIVSLRYFNPIGAHNNGLIGDDPLLENTKNLMPSIINVAKGLKEIVNVCGDDYETPDGTGIRDYIHVMDLAAAHVRSLTYIEEFTGFDVFNLGTGRGFSVMELINTFENVTGQIIKKNIINRRKGDVSCCFADPSKANKVLDWETKMDLKDMCLSAWNFSNSSLNK